MNMKTLIKSNSSLVLERVALILLCPFIHVPILSSVPRSNCIVPWTGVVLPRCVKPELYNLFHRNGRKTVPWCIAELLTPQGLAMCYGCKAKGGFYISINSFHYEEVQLLCNALKERLNLDCSIHLQRGQPRLYICYSSMVRFRSIVAPYFHSSMMYKLD